MKRSRTVASSCVAKYGRSSPQRSGRRSGCRSPETSSDSRFARRCRPKVKARYAGGNSNSKAPPRLLDSQQQAQNSLFSLSAQRRSSLPLQPQWRTGRPCHPRSHRRRRGSTKPRERPRAAPARSVARCALLQVRRWPKCECAPPFRRSGIRSCAVALCVSRTRNTKHHSVTISSSSDCFLGSGVASASFRPHLLAAS